MKRSVEVESRRIGGTGLDVGQGVGEGVGLVVGEGRGEGQGVGAGQGEGQGEGAGAPCPVQAHSCACPTQQASPSSTPPQSAALQGSGRSPVSLASKGGVA